MAWKDNAEERMQNIDVAVNGDIMTVRIDLSRRLGKSASGKTTIIATTGGNQKVAGSPDIQYGINVYTK